MRKRWFWSVTERLLTAGLTAGLTAALALAPAAGAKVLEHKIAVEVGPGGKVVERWRLKVAIETPGEVETWRRYPIYLDDNRQLAGFDGTVTDPGGERRKIGRKEQDLVQAASGGTFHSSARYHLVEAPGLQQGSILELAFSVAGEPYWTGGVLPVALGEESIESIELSLRVDPAAGALHFGLDGPTEGLTIEQTAQSMVLRGRRAKLPELPAVAGGGTVRRPLLHWAWGKEPVSWNDIGGWFAKLLAGVPQQSPEVEKLARQLTAGATTPRAKLEALVQHVRRKVRYVAVEVGIGGFRPHPPAEVASKLWGDCKDKSLLLIDLARAVGIEGWPVLILLDEHRRIDPSIPTPFQFNHMIAAFTAGPLEPRPGDPVADGLFFVDPTQEVGAAGYLHQGVQDQHGIVMKNGGAMVARLPTLPETASRKLAVELKLAADGSARGRAQIDFEGDGAANLLQFLDAAASQAPLEEALRGIFQAALRGARLTGLTYQVGTGALPRFSAAVSVEHPAYLEGLDRGGSLQAGGLRLFPENRDLEQIAGLEAAAPGSGLLEQTWTFELPAGFCPPEDREEKTENELGLFATTVKTEAGKLQLYRRAELRRPWVEQAAYPSLQELSIAEGKALQRRLRFACKG